MNEQPPPGYGQASNPAPATVGQPQVFKEFGTGGDGQQQMFHSPPAGIQSQPRSAFQAVSYMPVSTSLKFCIVAMLNKLHLKFKLLAWCILLNKKNGTISVLVDWMTSSASQPFSYALAKLTRKT